MVDVLVIADNRHASANRTFDCLLVGLYGLPLSGISGIIGHGLGDLGVPAVEHKALTGGSAAGESGSRGVLLQIGMDIVLKGFSVNAIGVGDGVELFPLSDVGRIFGHGFGNRGFPAEELVARAGGSALESGGGILVLCRISLIRECLAVHTVGVGHGVGVLFPNGVQIRPAVHGLASYVAVLTLTAPELEGVAGAGRGGSVRGGKGRTKERSGAVQPTFGLAVVILVVSPGFLALEVNDRDIVVDHALQIRPAVDGFLLQTGRGISGVALVDIKQAVVVPAVELVVPGVIVGNVDRGQVNDMTLRLAFERDVLISLRGVAVAINHKMDGNQFFFALDLECYGGVGGSSPCSVHIRHRKGLLGVIRQSVFYAIRFLIAIERINVYFSLDGDGAGISGGIIAGHFTDCERAGANFPRQIAMAGDTFNRYRCPSNFIGGRGGLVGLGGSCLLPHGSVGGISCYGCSDSRIPAGEDIALAGGGAVESGRCGAGQQITVSLVGKNLFILHAVGVGYGVFFLVLVRLSVSVGILFPHGSVGGISCYGCSDSRIPAGEDIAGAGGGAADKSGGCSVGVQVRVNIVCKNCPICAVFVGYGVQRTANNVKNNRVILLIHVEHFTNEYAVNRLRFWFVIGIPVGDTGSLIVFI